jgi:ribosome biogenesis GTPase
VISNFGHEILIRDESGENFRAVTRSQLPGLVSGDRVHWQLTDDHTAVIEQLVPRHGVLSRSTKNNPDKIVVSNVDKVLIVCAIKPAFKTGLIDRYLVACELAGITPVIIVNKADLLSEEKYDKVVNTLSMYERIGYDIYYISTKEHSNITQLRQSLLNATAVLVGQSGVGKSSIIRTLVPNATPIIAAISEATNKGRHTTSNSTLYDIDLHTHIIDSPGIREFGLKPLSADELSHGFREFRPFIGQCKFRDCTHHQEPGCAIAQAVKAGKIAPQRWESYRSIADSFSNAN